MQYEVSRFVIGLTGDQTRPSPCRVVIRAQIRLDAHDSQYQAGCLSFDVGIVILILEQKH